MGLFDSIKGILFGATGNVNTLPPLVKIFDSVNLCYIKELGDSLENAIIGAAITLEPEPSNPHDKKAVAVKCAGERIGYLYKGKLKNKIYTLLGKPGVVLFGRITQRNGDKIVMDIEYHEDIKVYTKGNGKSYHFDAFCVSHDDDVNEIKLSEAIKRGYRPCLKCCK